jgi:DNA-binding beta-propeller fold protein YncE
MATVSPRGDYLYVENAPVEGGPDAGSESIIDVRDPRAPVEVMRFTQEDGLGEGPITSEFTWDGRYGVVICRDSSELTVIDNDLLEIVRSIQLPEGSNPLTGTFDASGERFFVALPGRDAVAVVSVPDFELVELIPVGQRPMGVVFLETLLPDRPEVYYPAGVALASGREFPANGPDRCCGPV